MSTDTVSSRRSFLKGGAIVAAPLVAAAGPALAAGGDDRLRDEAAIRELHQGWLRRVNTEGFENGVRTVTPDHAAEPDLIELAGETATGRFHCTVEVETALPTDCTLTQMAHAQGTGVVRSTERRVLKAQYVKARSAWTIARLEFA